jgi:hypothetical protein
MVRGKKNGSEVAQPSSLAGFPKTDVRYWQGTIFQRTYRKAGRKSQVQHYSARVQHKGRREFFALEQQGLNRASAAEGAREIYLFLLANGWEATLAKYKPSPFKAGKPVFTVGDLVREVKATSTGKGRTLEDYIRSFRRITADIFEIEGGRAKYDYRSGGRQNWVQRVDRVKLEDITPSLVQKWKVDFLRRAGASPAKQRAGRISVNSLLRQARSIFSAKRLQFVKLGGLRSPFDGVPLEARQSMRYRSSFKIEELVGWAVVELGREELKVFLLACMAGLRRNEIDKLPWTAFNWGRTTLRVEVTEHFDAKSEDSIGEVDIDPEVLALFRGFSAKATGEFVIESDVPPRAGASYAHYRCQRIFTRLNDWLRSKGLPSRRPLHTLRKEFGSQICDHFGIYAASQALRHADIAITSQHYLDKRRKVPVGLGHLLALQEDPVLPVDFRCNQELPKAFDATTEGKP